MGRVGIYIGNQEVSERYVGNKLVWQKKTTLPIQARKIVLENVKVKLYSTFISFLDIYHSHDFHGKFNGKYVLKISVNGGQPIDLEPKSQQFELTTYNMYINNMSAKLKQYLLDNGVTYEYKLMNITFYLKE